MALACFSWGPLRAEAASQKKEHAKGQHKEEKNAAPKPAQKLPICPPAPTKRGTSKTKAPPTRKPAPKPPKCREASAKPVAKKPPPVPKPKSPDDEVLEHLELLLMLGLLEDFDLFEEDVPQRVPKKD